MKAHIYYKDGSDYSEKMCSCIRIEVTSKAEYLLVQRMYKNLSGIQYLGSMLKRKVE